MINADVPTLVAAYAAREDAPDPNEYLQALAD